MSSEQEGLEIVGPGSIRCSYQAMAEEMLDEPDEVSLEWLRKHRWAAVPMEDVIDRQAAEWISEATESISLREAVAITTESGVHTECFKVPLSTDGLTDFERSLHLRYFALFPEDREFLVLHEANYYYIVAGTPEFVERAGGGSIEQMRKRFVAYALEHKSESERNWLLSVAKRYEEFG
jgi:hypothetical protein